MTTSRSKPRRYRSPWEDVRKDALWSALTLAALSLIGHGPDDLRNLAICLHVWEVDPTAGSALLAQRVRTLIAEKPGEAEQLRVEEEKYTEMRARWAQGANG